MSSIQIRRFVALACAVSVVSTTPLYAADAPAASGSQSLEEVIVIARKREERLVDVPIAITSLSADALQQAGITDLGSLAATVPGFQYTQARERNSSLPGIRGIKSTEISPNRQKVSTFYDGMPVLGQQAVSQLVDVGRVEVYRGPQSAQFGRAVFGGAINYLSTPTNMHDLSGKVELTRGTDGLQSGSFLLTGPVVSDKLGVLISGLTNKYKGPDSPVSSDGFGLGGTNTQYGSAKITFSPYSWVTATLRYQKLVTDDDTSTNYLVDPNDPQWVLLPSSVAPNVNAKTSAKLVLGAVDFAVPSSAFNRNFCFTGSSVARPAPLAPTVYTANCIGDPLTNQNRNRYSADISFELPDNSNLTVSGFQSNDHQQRADDNDRTNLLPYYNTVTKLAVNPINNGLDDSRTHERFYQAVWISPNASRLRATLGASYYDYDFLTLIQNNATTLAVAQTFADATINKGVFGSAQYSLTDKLTLSGEVRYQEEDVTNFSPLINKGFTQVTKTTLPRYSLTYRVTPDITTYAQVARGNNPAGVNVDTLTPNKQAIATAAGTAAQLNGFLKFDEEQLWNYEVGIKGLTLNRKLRFDLAVYKLDWKNYVTVTNFQIATAGSQPTISTVASDYNSRVFYNAGAVDGKGVELSLAYEVSKNFNVTMAYAYTDTKYADACSPDIVRFGLPIAKTVPSACVDITGNSVPMIAKNALNVGATLTTPFANGVTWANRADANYNDKLLIDDANFSWIAPKTTLNFRSTLSKGDFSATAYVNNLTDNRTPSNAVASGDARIVASDFTLSGNAGQRYSASISAPRSYGVTLNYRF
jgi:outer membrane receptor protein involved in Fe transport